LGKKTFTKIAYHQTVRMVQSALDSFLFPANMKTHRTSLCLETSMVAV